MNALLSCDVSDPVINEKRITASFGSSISISWFQELKGDFSFANEWEYAEGIKINDYQQIICSKCSQRAEKMLDKRRKIYADSINVFYQLIDSTRHYYSLNSRSTLTNLNEDRFVLIKKYGDFTIEGVAKNQDGINCSLFFRIKDDLITSWIYIKKSEDIKIYKLKEGKFFADKSAFDRGILKANFSFVYESGNSLKPIYWSGKIHSKILGF